MVLSSYTKADTNVHIEKICIPGTYTSFAAAEAAAHNCLYDIGYKAESFAQCETDPEVLREMNLTQGAELSVFAAMVDGSKVRVRIKKTLNDGCLSTSPGGDKVSDTLYYVIETLVQDNGADENTSIRDIQIRGVFTTYEEAGNLADRVLLSEEDGITKDSYIGYDEARLNEVPWQFGENVLVHAVGDYGESYFVSVIRTKMTVPTSLDEAVMRIHRTY
ncbi:hypothetical protein AFLA70_276g000791 [Aspergillus flavus AF70]|nr:hypothetical protein AFLA70_276g000791 [Aspergillus flavus AF70]